MGEKWGKMGKKWVRNEITGVQKTVLMHASAHLAGSHPADGCAAPVGAHLSDGAAGSGAAGRREGRREREVRFNLI